MILIDNLFLGWYLILDNTIYSFKTNDNNGIGAREHSFFIVFLLNGINIWSLFRFVLMKYAQIQIGLYGSLIIAFLVFIIGYFLYYNHRSKEVLKIKLSLLHSILSMILSILYSIITVYFMLEIGDYIKNQLVIR